MSTAIQLAKRKAGDEDDGSDADDEDESHVSTNSKIIKKKKKRALKLFSEKKKMIPRVNYTGTTFGQLPITSISHDFSLEREAQALRHVSQLFFFYIRDKGLNTKEQEVEAMFAEDRIFIATNDRISIEKLLDNFLKEDGSLASFFSTGDGNVVLGSDDEGVRFERTKNKFSQRVQIPDGFGGVYTMLNQINAQPLKNAIARDIIETATESRDCFTNDTYKNKIIFIQNPAKHAEQKFIQMIAASGAKTDKHLIIRGKKRPCKGCYLTLRFAHEVMGLNLSYNSRSGLLWDTSCKSLNTIANLAVRNNFATAGDVEAWDQKVSAEDWNFHNSLPLKASKGTTQGFDSGSESESEDPVQFTARLTDKQDKSVK